MCGELFQKVAIKKMDMEATREFLAELKVLTNVHHLNLVKTNFPATRGMSLLTLFLIFSFENACMIHIYRVANM